MDHKGNSVMAWRARVYIALVITAGMICLVSADWSMAHGTRFACYLAICLLASAMKVNLPGILGTMSVNFLFILIGVLDMSAGQTMLMGCAGALVQCLWKPKNRLRPVQALFSVMNIAVASFGSYYLYHWPLVQELSRDTPVALILSSLAYFFLNTTGIAGVVALTERKSIMRTWRTCYFWSFPFYLMGASIAWIFSVLTERGHGQSILMLLPVVYVIYRSYRMYLTRLEDQKKHMEEMAGLHLRTIEALALAIDAKDHSTHEHLSRVRTYAIEVAQELGLQGAELEALRAAALLHDIGKLAVPEHIISKPGKLTPEEFEKMKIHPVVGAEILERVEFPYPVVPIVRSHHEKWDGTGYPDSLKGEEIPIGARILSVVDCLDALATDRQYRRALPLDEAMKVVRADSGKAFDLRVVAALEKGYVEWERKAQIPGSKPAALSTEVKVERGAAPAAGFEATNGSLAASAPAMDFLNLIAAARQEVQALFEISQDLGNSLSLDETLSVLDVRLRHIIPHHSLAVWLARGEELIPQYVNGEDCRLFSSLRIPMGQGLSGWVAENSKPIVNGNPSVEPSYLNDRGRTSSLQSAVAVPLEGANGVLGVLTLYHMERDAFTKDHLRILMAISPKIGMSIENALRFQQAESSATTDYLTSLPNARSLFLQLDAEISRAKRNTQPLTVVVLDLDELKQVNDRYGHLEGNRVLREMASGLKTHCREYDYVARMGGDEFVVLISGVKPADAESRVDEFRRVVAGIGSHSFGQPLSASIGVAHYPRDGGDAERLLAEADRMMYQQKRTSKHHRASSQPQAWTRD